jgi:hypothetical protein
MQGFGEATYFLTGLKIEITDFGIALKGIYVIFPNLKVLTGPEIVVLTGINFDELEGAE